MSRCRRRAGSISDEKDWADTVPEVVDKAIGAE